MVIGETREKDGFHVPKIEMLLIIKQKVFEKRHGSIKGEKDKIDIIALLREDIDFVLYKKLLAKYKVENLRDELIALLNSANAMREIGLTNHKLAQLRKKILRGLQNG